MQYLKRKKNLVMCFFFVSFLSFAIFVRSDKHVKLKFIEFRLSTIKSFYRPFSLNCPCLLHSDKIECAVVKLCSLWLSNGTVLTEPQRQKKNPQRKEKKTPHHYRTKRMSEHSSNLSILITNEISSFRPMWIIQNEENEMNREFCAKKE